MAQPYERERAIALAAVREAARLCHAVQQTLGAGVMHKDDRSPVTLADFGAQALVCRRLAEAFGCDPIIAEESAAALSDASNADLLHRIVDAVRRIEPAASADDIRRWIDRGSAADFTRRYWTLDPIDGTKGFLRGDQYAVALALVVDGQLTVAAMATPNLAAGPTEPRGAVFTAIAGHGAWVQPLAGGAAPQRIRVSATADPAAARFCESLESGHSSHDASADLAAGLKITTPPLRMDSQAKYAVVARGEADLYLRLPRADYVENIWDHAAGALIVAEAGGRVSDLAGRPLDFTHGRRLESNRGVVVSNGRIHDAVLDALAELGVK